MTQRARDRLLDETGWRILDELQRDGRISFAELGRRVHLSTPAVAERVRRMEEAGIITGYRAVVNPAALGLPIRAVIRVRANLQSYERARQTVMTMPEVVEAHHLTGADDLLLTVLVCSVDHLETVLDRLRPFGDHVTSLILSSPVNWRPVAPAAYGEGCGS